MTILRHPRLKEGKKIELHFLEARRFFILAIADEDTNIRNYSECDICFHICVGSSSLEETYSADITKNKRKEYAASQVPKVFMDKALKMGLITKKET